MSHDMSGRVARFDELHANRQAFVDSKLPGHERENFRIIGKGVTEDPADRPAITMRRTTSTSAASGPSRATGRPCTAT